MNITDDLHCIEVPFDSEFYRQSVVVRDRILRKPLGLQFSEDDLRRESTDHHLVCMKNDDVVGVILMRPSDNGMIQMRQVAVDEHWQHKGIGSILVKFAEQFSLQKGYNKIIMHARKPAVLFYLRLDYQTEGAEFTEVGIPHYVMTKVLSH